MDEGGTPPIAAAIERLAARWPDRPALVHDGVPVAYGQLAREVRGVAAHFARAGLGPGDAVGVSVAEERLAIPVALALLRLGCRQVALPPRDPAPVRADLAARLTLAAVVGLSGAEALGAPLVAVPDLAAAAHEGGGPAPPAAGTGDVVVGTSGTTGRPKLMLATEPLLVDQAATLAGYGTVFHRAVPFDSNYGKRLSLRSLVTGGTEVLGGDLTPEALAALCARHGVTRVHMPPQVAEALLAGGPRVAGIWPAAARIFTTGARIPQALRLGLQKALGCGVHVQYGSTEAGMVTIAGPDEHARHPDTVGAALPGVDIALVDDDGRAVPAGEEGLIRIRSPGAIAGYLDDAEATARHCIDGWYQPGDIGRFAPWGALLVAGRRDDMMSLGTIKILPAEIEAVAEGFPGLRDCAAFPVRSASLGDIPVLAVVGDAGFDGAALLAHCRARLGLRAPRKVVAVDAIPRNAMGKVLRRALAEVAR